MLGYTNAHDGQGINQWIYGRMFNPATHPDAAISGGDYLPHMFRDLEVNMTAEAISFMRVTGAASYMVFAFDNEEEIDPENAVAYITVAAPAHDIYLPSQWNVLDEFDISSLFAAIPDDVESVYIRVQAIAPVFAVRGQTGVNWGENSPVSLVAEVVEDDPFADADAWAALYLPEALEAGLLSERMFSAWTVVPTRVEAAEDIVRFAKVFLGAEDLAELYEMLELDEVEPWADTEDANARFLRAAGVSTGLDYVNYGPDLIFTRAHMIVMLYRLADTMGLDMEGYPLGSEFFDDVPNWPQAEEAIGWAYEVGITAGTGGRTFSPNSPLQNQHIAVFAIRALRALAEG